MSMVNWQVTATTIYCDAVDDEITLLVYKLSFGGVKALDDVSLDIKDQ